MAKTCFLWFSQKIWVLVKLWHFQCVPREIPFLKMYTFMYFYECLKKLCYNLQNKNAQTWCVVPLKKNWKIIFGLENRGEKLFFMSRHFDQTMSILTSHLLHFGALKRITGDCFVIRINKMTYSKPNMGCFINYFSIFTTLFLQHVFTIHLYRVAYKWRMEKLHISK